MTQLGPGGGGEDLFEQRLRLLGAVMALTFVVFAVRLFQLQILEGDTYQRSSQKNSIRTERLIAPRGEIVDRDGRVLATTRPAFNVEVVPSELRRPEHTLTVLASLLGDTPDHLRAIYGDPRGRLRFQPVRLADDLDWERLARVEAHHFALPGVITEVRPFRNYPNGPLAAHLLGTLGEVRSDQLESDAFADYRSGDVIGQSGIEAELEPDLRGHAGGRNVVVDVAGREVEVLDRVEPTPGGRVVLALDLDLQRTAEQGLAATAPEGEQAAGAVVALDPRNGDVLVLASLPSFDPNDFAGRLDPAVWHALMTDPRRPLQDRAISGQYPPGSTFKPFVAAAALQAGVRTAHTTVFCPGSLAFGNRIYRCWRHQGHGNVDLRRAIMQSCDVYFYKTGIDLGIDRLARYARAFGLGSPTGIRLDGEKGGIIPSSGWKERRFGQAWMPGETLSAAIGQGYDLVTPLQLAVAYAAIANDGRVMRPRLVLQVMDHDGETRSRPPEVVSTVPVSPANLALVRDGLRAVVEEPGGTGGRARVPGLAVAGKTGTAQVVRLEHTEGLEGDQIPWKYRDHAWFASYAPADAPEIVVVALVEHGGHGGSAAGPVAQKVLQAWWDKKNGRWPPPAPPAGPPPAVTAAAAHPGGGDGAD
jgi:penicillin-binding protein 2